MSSTDPSEGPALMTWPKALEAMSRGHNVASPHFRKLGYHVRALMRDLTRLQLVKTGTGDVVVDHYNPTPANRAELWEIVREGGES